MKKIICLVLSVVLLFSLSGAVLAAEAPEENGDIVIYLTRHGKTMFNVTGQMQGWSDTSLMEEGIQLAQALGAGLKDSGITFDAVYSSDLNRQRMTAKYAMEQLGIPYDELKEVVGLREVCYGSSEGQPGDPIYQQLVDENNLADKVELSGKFCMGKCGEGVCVTVDDVTHIIQKDQADEFFKNEILAKV